MTERTEKIRKTAEALIPWFETCGRDLPWRADRDPYHVWISEIMLQQTRIETVIPYYFRFLRELPDIRALSEADPERLHKLWEGLGYYSRVRNLQKAAAEIMSRFDGRFPDTYEEIRSLPGIGDYTAGALSSICFDLPEPAVDGNVLRVLSRITADARPVSDEKLKKAVREELRKAYPERGAGSLTQGIMELGETLCIPNGTPDCEACPCRGFCASRDGEWAKYPVKEAKKARRVEEMTVFLLRSDGLTALRKRPEKGLLSGLWELPNCAGAVSLDEARKLLETWGLRPVSLSEKPSGKHVFTHVEWNMKCYEAFCQRKAEDFTWVTEEALREEISLPTAFRKLLPVKSFGSQMEKRKK